MEPSCLAIDIIHAIECQEEDVIIADLKANIGIFMNTVFPSFFSRIMKKRAKDEKICKVKND